METHIKVFGAHNGEQTKIEIEIEFPGENKRARVSTILEGADTEEIRGLVRNWMREIINPGEDEAALLKRMTVRRRAREIREAIEEEIREYIECHGLHAAFTCKVNAVIPPPK